MFLKLQRYKHPGNSTQMNECDQSQIFCLQFKNRHRNVDIEKLHQLQLQLEKLQRQITLTFALTRSSYCVFSVSLNFFPSSYKIILLKNEFVTLFLIQFS